MKTSDESWSGSLRLVGDLERPDHWYLTEADVCYFFGEYTAHKGYAHSATNQLIANLKKKPSTRSTPQWGYKTAAIGRIARAIAANLKPGALQGLTFVPIPPSKPPDSPEYDDRMSQVARQIGPDCDVREILHTVRERDPRHMTSDKRHPAALRATLGIRDELIVKPPQLVVLLDDVLTTGCSYTVCRDMLVEAIPGLQVVGIFVARRAVDRTAGFEGVIDLVDL
jgi:hypothetical protein